MIFLERTRESPRNSQTRMGRRVYSFGPFQLDLEEQILSRDGHAMALKPKVFEVLAVLVENSGRVMCKDELLEKVWADRFVEEGNLAVSIFEIRKALGSDNGGQHYVETVPRRGYRFAATVVQITNRDEISESRFDPKLVTTSRTNSEEAKDTIAVLPFKSIGTSTNEYLGLGIADALITKLSNLKQITVRPTSSVRKYGDSHDPIAAGKEQRVEWVLDGSVQLSGERIRLTVQLVHVRDEAIHWAEKFDESFTDIFGVEDSISQKVLQALEFRMTGDEKRLLSKRFTEDPKAYELYLKGRYFLEKRTADASRKAIDHFERAIMIDPTFALAYAGIAGCYVFLSTASPSQSCNREAEGAASIALRIDPALAEAHTAIGYVKMRQWDWLAAELSFKSAIELSPNYPTAHANYAILLAELGRFNEALEEINVARAIDPLSLIISSQLGSVLYLARDYDQAVIQFRKTLSLDEDFGVARFVLGYVYETLGEHDAALREWKQSQKTLGNLPEFISCVGRISAFRGNKIDAYYAIEHLKELSCSTYVQPNYVALVFAALGEYDQAFEWFERAFVERDGDLSLLKVDPRMDCLRSDPRFINLLQRVGLGI